MQLEFITQDLGAWVYVLLGLLVMIEGPVATLAGAAAASAGFIKPEGVFVAASAGNLLADSLWYTLGYLGKLEWLERHGRWVGLTSNLLHHMRHDIQMHAARLLLISKLTLGFSIPTLVATGFSHVPVRRWFPALLLGETIWTFTLVLVGYHFGRYVQTMERSIQWIAIGAVFLFSFLFIIYLARLRKRGEIHQETPAQSRQTAAAPVKR